MEIRIIILVFVLAFISCSRHHEMEKLTLDIAKSNRTNIDSVFFANKKNTLFFMDSILQENKPSLYFCRNGCFLNGDYKVEFRHNKFYQRMYYFNLNHDGSKILITLFNTKNKLEKINFYYEKANNNWILRNISIKKHFDFDINN